MKFKLRYVEQNYSQTGTLATYIGSILHKGLELKAIAKMQNKPVDYEYIKNVVTGGWEQDKEKILGTNEITTMYFSDWFALDEQGISYDDKLNLYLNKVLPTRMEDSAWTIKGAEVPFEFVYDERCIVHGFIDRMDEKEGCMKVVDYKSSKKIFPETKIKTPLQMVIYDMACVFLYGILPEEHEYDFILLNQKQTTRDGVCSKGYLKRGIKALDKLLDEIDELKITDQYLPSPTPLCYWCSFTDSQHSPNADPLFSGLCPYHSLWTPEDRTFAVNIRYGEEYENQDF